MDKIAGKFSLGRTVMTRGVNDTVADNEDFAKEIMSALRRYVTCDWGDLESCDKKLNDSAVKSGNDRIVAAYETCEGKVYIITEWDRSYTTLLFVHEY